MRGLKHNDCLTIETKTGFKGKKVTSQSYKNAEYLEIFDDLNIMVI